MDEGLVERLAALRAEEEAARATVLKALGAGLIGATALTAAHEAMRRSVPRAPRMDRVGERALSAALKGLGQKPPRGVALHRTALAGDLLANGLYYGLLLTRRPFRPFLREAVGGALAGLGALLLPRALGLGRPPHAERPRTQLLTVGLYVAGGLAAAAAFRLFAPRPDF